MALKDLVVYIDDADNSKNRISTAIQLAQAHGAHLTGLHVIYAYTPVAYNSIYGMELSGELLEAQRNDAKARAQTAEDTFREMVKDTQLDTDWRCIEGDFITGLNLKARCTDLVVVGQSESSLFSNKADMADAMVFGLGRPVMVVPKEYQPSAAPGKNILLAWDDSRESAKAAGEALLLMQQAERVDVVTIETDDNPDKATAQDMADWLHRHGINTQVHQLSGKESEVGDMLLNQAASSNSDLIVMGAYGHSRLREIILGGSTRHVLSNMKVPVFMAH